MKTGLPLRCTLWLVTTGCAAQSLTVRVYDHSTLDPDELTRATAVVTRTFLRAGIEVNWMHCRGRTASAATAHCEGDLPAGEIMLRLQAPRTDGSRRGELGSALVSAVGGQYATVLVPRVLGLSRESGVSFDLVLGHSIAHEIGHCLLGPRHSVAGLMRAAWTRRDIQDIAQQRLGLSGAEASRAAARLRADGAEDRRAHAARVSDGHNLRAICASLEGARPGTN